MTKNNCNILLSSAGRRVALMTIFKKTLEEMNLKGEVMATDMSLSSSAFHIADKAFIVPRCTENSFVREMLDICEKNEIRLIIPTIDTELPIYAENRDLFSKVGTEVVVSSPSAIAVAGDKEKTHSWLLDHDFPTVRQTTVEIAKGNLRKEHGFDFPFLVKPKSGSSSIGVAIVNNLRELDVFTNDGDYVVQSIAPGIEYTVDSMLNRKSKCICAVPRRRLEVRAGEVSKGMTVRAPEIQTLAKRISESLPGAFGVVTIQIFWDEKSGELNVIEINPRFGGGYPLSFEAGANFPKCIIEESLGLPQSSEWDQWKDKLVMLRFDDAIFVDSAKSGYDI